MVFYALVLPCMYGILLPALAGPPPAGSRGGPGVYPPPQHDLRQEYACRLAERGVPVTKIQALLGHASITTTQRYIHHTLAELSAATTVLETGATFDPISAPRVSVVPHSTIAREGAEHEAAAETDDADVVGTSGPPGDRTRDTVIKSRARCSVQSGLHRNCLDIQGGGDMQQ
jgi:hypothetical protein